MTEQRSLPEVLELQNKKLAILYEIALTVGKSLDLKIILDDVLDKVIAFMGVDAGVIYVIDDVTLEMVPVSFRNLSTDVVNDLCENKVKVGECMCGTIAQCDKEVIIYERASSDSRFTRGVLRQEGMEFYAGLPLKAKEKVVGVLCVITHTPYRADPELLDILRAATRPIGLAIENAVIFEQTRKEAERRTRHYNFEGIIAGSPGMMAVLDLVRKVTDIPSSILLYGESGTGKELIARAIHFNSPRKDGAFVVVNCAAIPESLLESELFGYVRGAFTGASGDKRGLFEEADSGTIFFDEVEAMSKTLQVKLLRFLQDRTFLKVGSTKPVSVDVRIIAATNQSLEDAIKGGEFREDLYYRLNVIKIEIPPLRERRDDIPLLARYFMGNFSRQMGKNVRKLSEDAMSALLNYSWPGNIRELQNALERAVAVTSGDGLLREDLPPEVAALGAGGKEDWTLARAEKEHILKVLSLVGGNRKKAARLLGLDATTLWRKFKRTGQG